MIGLTKLAPGPGHVALAERPEPAPGPGEVVLVVSGAGICGTDLHIEAAEYPSQPPVTMGHEVCGTVLETGAGVDERLAGTRVVSETFFSTCGACGPCRDRRPNLCPDRRSIGTHVDGAFAPRLVVPVRGLHAIPAWLDDHAAALSEPLACVCQCLLDPPVAAPGQRVLVTGPGPIGLLSAQVARALGGDVLVTGLTADAGRLAVARELGFETATDAPGDESADVAIECSGSEGGAAACLAAARRGGRYVQVGIFGKPVRLLADALLYKELELSTGFASTPRSWRHALTLIERRDVRLEPLLSEVVALADWKRAFSALRGSAAMKIVFDPRLSRR